MKNFKKKILGAVLPIGLLLISSHVFANQQSQEDKTQVDKPEITVSVPELGKIIPSAAKLSDRLAFLEYKVKNVLDISELEKRYAEIEKNLKDPSDQLQKLKDAKELKFNKLVELKYAIELENDLFEKISRPLDKVIRKVGAWRKEWLAEKKHWNEWQSSLSKEGSELEQVKLTFTNANNTIDTALNLISRKLEVMLTLQAKFFNIQAKRTGIATELGELILGEKRSVRFSTSPPMFSSQYFSRFSSELWHAVPKGLSAVTWPGSQFFSRHIGLIFLQVFFLLVVIIAVYRNREILNESKRWHFLAVRPFSAGIFLGTIITLWLYEYSGAVETWQLLLTIIGGIAFARLLGVLIKTSWKRHFAYGAIIFLNVTKLMDVVNLPIPLFRIYIVLTSVVGFFLCVRWANKSRRIKGSGFYTILFRLMYLLFAVIIISELWVKEGLAKYLFEAYIRSATTVLVFVLFMYLIHGGIEWLFRTSLIRQSKLLYRDTDIIIRRVAFFIDFAICGLVLIPAILMIWGVYDSLDEAMKGLLTLGFNIGSQRISIGLVIISAGIFYGALLVSGIIQKLIMDEVLITSKVEKGVRVSIGRLINYVIIFIGFLLALSALGLDFTKLTIILSALGVGIGFGLQGVVNNFVSGLILLFERPVREGDIIELDGKWAEIKSIGLRATIVQTPYHADMIIPNADMINNQVTNWTLSNRKVRFAIPVGVAYGSDVPLVIEKLMACGKSNLRAAKTPLPEVLFLSFGESSLNFELRVWIWDASYRLSVINELNQEIDRSFREAEIEIAFPQLDLHLRSVDKSVVLQTPEAQTNPPEKV